MAATTDNLLRGATTAHQVGDRAQAERLYRQVLSTDKKNPDALHYFGLLQAENGRLDEAARLLRQAIRFGARSADVHANLGRILNLLDRHQDALESYEKALAINPDHPAALMNYAGTLLSLHLPDKALPLLDRLLRLDPNSSIALHNRCIALIDLTRYEEAIAETDKLLARDKKDPEAWSKRGIAFARLQRYDDARLSYQKSLETRPRSAAVLTLLGNLNFKFQRFDDAVANYDEAIAADEKYAPAWLGRGNLLAQFRHHQEAFAAFDRAYGLQPNLPSVEGNRLHSKMHICDWSNLAEEMLRLRKHVREGKYVANPFAMVPVSPSLSEQLRCAETYASNTYPSSAAWSGTIRDHDRIRVAYLSGEFRDHAISVLTADLFECHDKSKFDVFAVSTGIDDDSPMRRRLMAAFGEFFDARNLSSTAIVEWIKTKEIDILVNLNGYIGYERTDVFLQKPAPIQVNYLGYPGTMGATYMDYIIADPTLVGDDEQAYFTEKIAYLPDTYQPNDRHRPISSRRYSRSEMGLPDDGFVYCCFNNTYKMNPDIFDVWMNVLRRVEASVLWLPQANAAVEGNLKREAGRRGISEERIVFAKPLPALAEHLSRLRLADLFLDTLPFNAHTTASDALWAGVPVLTCRGSTFAGRVADSLLRAIGLDDLVKRSLADYEAAAVAIAKDAASIAEIKERLQRNRESHPLFDTPRYTRHIEAAYAEMWQRHRQGRPPASFRVNAPTH